MVLGAPPSQPLKAEKLVCPPKDAPDKSHGGNSPWPRILELSPRPFIVQRITSASPCGNASALCVYLKFAGCQRLPLV